MIGCYFMSGLMTTHECLLCFEELVHVSNGFSDLLGNQLTTPVVSIEEEGRIVEITYANEASDLQFSVFTANQLGHINPRQIHLASSTQTADELEVIFTCM